MKTALGIALLLGALGSAASAETSHPISISLGAFAPSDSDTRHRAGTTVAMAELRYALPSEVPGAPQTVISGTFARGNLAVEGASIVSLTAGKVFSAKSGQSPLAAQAVYFGTGGGVYGMDLKLVHAFFRVGAYAEAGYNLSDALFVNAQYRFVDRGNGASLTLGARF